MKFVVAFSRIFVGVLFIISGFIKANDPLGFSYKLDEYFLVFHTPWMSAVSLPLAILISAAEIGLGFATLIGARMRFVAWSLLGLIVFFTFLTFYSAWFNVVKDCGCFGDALHLEPWQSFGKDIILLVFILVLFFYRNKITPLINPKSAWLASIVSFIISAGFSLYCYMHLPVVDFRPYAIGKNILKGMEIPEGAPRDEYQTILYYEKDGVVKEFTSQNYPWQDSTWKWKDTKNVLVKKGYVPPIHDFSLNDASGSDYKEELLADTNYSFMLVSYDLNTASKSVQPEINKLAQDCEKNGIKFFAVTATVPEETEKFRHEYQTMYDFYFCDATALKTIIRSNPGLVLLKKGTVVDMWHYNDIPDFKDFKNKYLKK